MDLTPMLDYILIERLPTDAIKTEGRIFLPNRDANECKYARVVAVGPGRTTEYGIFIRNTVAVGQLVLTYPNPGTPVQQDGVERWFIRPADILAVCEEP